MVATAGCIDARPWALRHRRGEGVGLELPAIGMPLEIGKGRVLREGTTVALVSFGGRLQECLGAADQLQARGLSTTVADARFAKPRDAALPDRTRVGCGKGVTVSVDLGGGRRLQKRSTSGTV